MVHNLKIQQKYLMRIISREKSFEVRYNDRDYQAGDTINFVLLEDANNDVYGLISPLPEYQITYVHAGLGMKECYVVLGIREIQ